MRSARKASSTKRIEGDMRTVGAMIRWLVVIPPTGGIAHLDNVGLVDAIDHEGAVAAGKRLFGTTAEIYAKATDGPMSDWMYFV